MNKTLMGASVVALSSAQVSVAQAAEWDLDWGGFFNTHLAFSSEDGGANSDNDGFDVLTNAEIIFTPSITLDNGLTFGARVEFEADPLTTNNTDEAWAYVKGSFGEIRAGAEDSPFGAMMTGAPSYIAGVTSGTLTGTYLPSGYGAFGHSNQISGDAQKIIYYTPRFSGFQVGVSYARAANKNDRGWEARDDIFSIGANYDTSFGSTSITLAGTFETDDNDNDRFSLGAQLGFGGFTVGGGFADYNNRGEFYNLGVGYEAGPWGVALSGSISEPDGGGDETNQVSLNGKYDLGPGVSARGYIGYAEVGSQDGFGIGTGINLSF